MTDGWLAIAWMGVLVAGVADGVGLRRGGGAMADVRGGPRGGGGRGPLGGVRPGRVALARGDGIGGTVGRRFGRHPLRVPFGKPKSWEGAAAVTAFAALGAWIALRWYGAEASPLIVLGAGVIAGVAEALSPRATDNA